MPLLARLARAGLGLLLAVPVGTIVLVGALVLDPAAGAWVTAAAMAGFAAGLSDLAAGLPPEALPLLLAGLAQAAFVLLVVPPTLTALIGAVLRRHGPVWSGLTCGAITAALPWLVRGAARPGGSALAAEARITAILFVAGASAGLVYGLVAGGRGDPGRRPEV